MAETINGVPIGDLPGIESVPDDSMLVVEFLGKAYHMPGAVLRQMIQDVLDSMGDSVDDVTEARLTAAIETVLSSGKYNGVSPLVEVTEDTNGTSVIHVVDAFGIKDYPVEVKGARNAVQYVEQELTEEQKAQARENIGIGEIGNSVVVELSGNPTDGYTALLSGEAVTGDELDEMAKNGSHITGVATESLVFQVSNGINGTSYTVPNGTIFSYGNAIVTGNPGFYGTGGVHSFEFRVCLQDYNFAIAYKAVANQDEKVWVSATQATHMVFRLGISQGIPAVLYGTQMLYGNSVPNMNYLYTILAESQLLNRPVFCYQVNMPFYTEDGTEMTPYSGVLFSLKINSAYQYFFEAEHEGYVYRFTVKQNEGYSCTAEPTEVYKKVQSKGDDLKAEDGTLFLLSAGEPIGEGVPLPAGSADDSKIFIADLNTSTYEEIKAANDAGKICYALWGGYTACMLTTLSGDSAIFTTLLDPHLGIYVKFTKGTAGVSDFGLTDSHSILYEPQSLTDAQKAQARENIGALSADDIDADSIGNNVFVGKYDTVTFTEIKAAHDAGRVCFLDLDGLMLPLLFTDDTEAIFVREVNENTDYRVTITADDGKDLTLVEKNTPIYVAQTLTDDQKTQARTNIGALSTDDINTVLQQAKDSGQFDGPAGPAGPAGPTGATGPQGPAGPTGATGKTAYAYAQDGGYTGTEAEFAEKMASDSDNVFVADYDTTTFAEVKAAHDSGKVCFVKSDGMPFCQLLGITDSEAVFVREVNDTTDYKVTFTSAGGKDLTLVEKNTPIYIAQTLTDTQKTQARTNIGAAAAADIAKTASLGISNSAAIYVKISDFGSWGTGAWYQKGFAMLITSRAGEMVWVAISSDDSNTNAKAIRLLNTYSKIAAIYYSASESAVYVKANAWCNNINAHIISNINGDYVPTVAQASALPSDAVQITITEFGAGSGKTSIGDASRALGMTGSATRPTYNGADMALSSDLSSYAKTVAPANVAGTEQLTAKFHTSNGGSIAFGKEGPNSGTMIRLDQADGTCRLRFRGSDTAGAMVWEQPEQGAQLYVDLGKEGVDKHRILFPSSAGTLALTSQIPSLSGYLPLSGGLMTGQLLTSFKNSVAMGSYQAGATTIPALVEEVRFSSGCMGSVSIGTAYTNGGVTIATGWYNFIYSPHRSGGLNGATNGDNVNYGTLLLYGMTVGNAHYRIRVQGGSIVEVARVIDTSYTGTLPNSISGTAARATADANGNNIASTYLPIGGGTMAGPLWITGGDSATAGKLVLNNNGSGQITDSGTSTLFGFVSTGNLTVGHGSYNLVMRGKASRPTYNGANVALVSDVVEAANGSLKVTLSGNASSGYKIDKTFAEIQSAWNAGRKVYLYNGNVFNLSYMQEDFMAVFTSVILSNNAVTIQSAMIMASDSSVFGFETKTL